MPNPGIFASGVQVPASGLPISVPFTGSNGDPWPAPWTITGTTGFGSSIQGNKGRLTLGAAGGYNDGVRALYGDIGTADFEASFDVNHSGVQTEVYPTLAFRTDGTWTGVYFATNGFHLEVAIDANTITLYRIVAGSRTDIGSATIGTFGTSGAHAKVRCVGTSIKARCWIGAASEPGTWDIDLTDANHTARQNIGFSVIGGSAASNPVDFDNFAVVAAP